MVTKFGTLEVDKTFKNHISADVIILGCSLPGIVTAHNLKKKFGTSMNIVMLDLGTADPEILRATAKREVAFTVQLTPEEDIDNNEPEDARTHIDSVARYYLDKYAQELEIPRSVAIPQKLDPTLNKLFQYRNGSTVICTQDYHEFNYLNFVERFELEQYQTMLDYSIQNLFHMSASNINSDRARLLYYDQTTMEAHLCGSLLLPTSREIMRTIVRLSCGTTADEVSVLFYLHQCYRVNSSKNQIDGDNIRLREKLLGNFRRRLTRILQKSVEDITLKSKPIEKIRMSEEERVVLEPVIGETDYICKLLAMAIRPDQLGNITLTTDLLAERDAEIMAAMSQSVAMKFVVQYEENFWRQNGYSGDILSIHGPILWATECPKLSTTRDSDKYATLIGYLKTQKIAPSSARKSNKSSKEAALEQLVKLFGEDAASPVSYNETPIGDIFIPRCGDYVALRHITMEPTSYLDWSALDVFADGDVAGAVEAGHRAYLHLLGILRPQAISYYDVAASAWPVNLGSAWNVFKSSINLISTTKFVVYGAVIAASVKLVRSYLRK